MDIIITLPKKIKWKDYKIELKVVESSGLINFKVPRFPKNTVVNEKCFLVHDGLIKGYMLIHGFTEKEFVCSVTEKKWTGKFIERYGQFYYLDKMIKYKGFQGWRYFDLNKYLEEING